MAVTEEVSPLERKIIRQVEYYFGDFNLPRDKFLKEAVKEDEGWLTIETLLKFQRLSVLSKDGKAVITALSKSDSGLLELDQEGDGKVRRSPEQPLPENTDENKKLLEAKTAYAKGYDKDNTTMDELLEYYAEHEPTVVHVQMRNYTKDKKKCFKGSVFLTFRNEEACTAFVEAEVKKYKDVDLIRMKQKAYHEMKQTEYEEKKNKRGGDKKANTGADQPAADGENGDKPAAQNDNQLPKGAVIKITGLGGEITREDIKAKLNEDFEVKIEKENTDIAFITYQKGEEEAKVRFNVENYGKTLMEKLEKVEKITIKDMELKFSLLEGEEEEQFLADSLRDLMNHRNKGKNHKRRHNDRDGGRGGGRGGRGGYQGKRFKKN